MDRVTSQKPAAAVTPFSSLLWEIDWSAHLPHRLDATGGVQVRLVSYADCSEFAARNYREIYGHSEDSRFLMLESGTAKARFYETMGDCFGFFVGEKMVGMFVCTPSDWSTYHIRNVSILAECQNLGLCQGWLEPLLRLLKERGVQRVITDAAPSNARSLNILLKAGFRVTGNLASERWGLILVLTKFLSEAHQNVFERQFCHDVPASGRTQPGAAADSKKGGGYEKEIRTELLLNPVSI